MPSFAWRTRITIRGEITDKTFLITVTDNGSGFDVANTANSEDGHFGLDGIRQRIKRLDGTFKLSSQPGRGTRAAICIPLHPSP